MSTKQLYFSPAQLQQGIKLGHILKSLDRPQQQEVLAAIKGQLEILKNNTPPNDVTRQALHLACLSTTMVYHALGGNLNACRDGMDKLDRATQALAEHLFQSIVEPDAADVFEDFLAIGRVHQMFDEMEAAA